tara:strand:- start:845 stop:1006 length:162 start_codon:yes stop_codon:yes gene_type:complete
LANKNGCRGIIYELYWAIGGDGSTNTLDKLNINSWSTEMNINLWTTTGTGGTE